MFKTEINLTCSNCLFYKDLIHPCEHFTCKLAGYLEYASPCSNFCYNTHQMPVINNDNKDLLSYIRKIPTNKLNELAALLVQEGYNRNSGWSIGDICYFNLGKQVDCIANYVQVVFKGLAGNLDMALIEGVGSDNKVWLGIIQLDSLLKTSQWQEKHQQLLKEKKFYDENKFLETYFPGYKYPSIEEMSKPYYTPRNIQDVFRCSKEG